MILGRMGFAGRMMAILLLALFALIALLSGISYVQQKRSGAPQGAIPLPGQVASVIELIERSAVADQQIILRAVSSNDLSVTISASDPDTGQGTQRLPGLEWLIKRYSDALGDRDVRAFINAGQGIRVGDLRFGQYWVHSRQPFRLAVALKVGGFAVFQTRGDIAPRLLGLPAGFWFGVVGALVGIAALMVILREAKPLRQLVDSVETFKVDAVPRPIAVRGAPEFRKLIAAINDMQSRIAGLVKGRTVLLGAISHDLKTYITRLRLRAELMEESDRRERTIRDLEDMSGLIDDGLAIARGAAISERRETVDLAELIRGEIADALPDNVQILAMSQRATISGDPVALRRMLNNVIGNAIRYGNRAKITLTNLNRVAELSVDDDGPGIPESEREAIFEPFYRLEHSRNRRLGGSGLGLAIVRQIVDAHSGKVSVDRAPSGGARFTIRLPSI